MGIREDDNDSWEREETPAVIATKIEQILETVHEIKDKLSFNENKISDMQREMDMYKMNTEHLKDRMDKAERKQEETKKYIWGIIGTIITTAIIGILNLVTKTPIF